MIIMISEIINKAASLKSHEEKVEWLRKNDSAPLRNILIAAYDKNKIQFLIPNTEPPYNPSQAHENQGALYREARKLKYIVAGFGGDAVSKIKRENIFIELLETVHREDAKILIDMIKQKGYKGLTAKAINEAYGNIINVEEKNVQEG